MACSLVALVCGACSLFVDLSTDQCTSDGDCDRLGAALTCSAGTCVGPTSGLTDGGPEGGAEGGQPCVGNAQCIDDNFGEPFICEKTTKRCVSVKLNEACAFVLPEAELRNDNAVLFGAFMPLKDQSAPLGQPIALAYKLALEEIQKAGGLPGGGGPRKPLVAVICDSTPKPEGSSAETPNYVELGVKHLTGTLHVPAVISLFSQTGMTTFFQDSLLPSGTFTLNPQDTTEALKLLDAKRLLWHLLGTPEDVALAYKPLLARMEPKVKAAHGNPTSIKVALVTSASPTEESIAAVVRDAVKGIEFNGKNADANGALFKSITIPSLEADPTAQFGSVVSELASFGPNVVVLLTSANEAARITGGYDDATKTYRPGLDAALTVDGGPGLPLPYYLLGPRNARASDVLAYLGTAFHGESSDAKARRFIGLQYAGAADKNDPQSQYQQFLKRFAEKNPTVDPATYAGVDNYYDAVYWLAYGLYAAGPGAPVQGSSFGEGVRKLVTGPDVFPGTVAQISSAFTTITTSSEATFRGALGVPNFDTASGAQRSVGSVYCYEKNSAAKYVPKYDVLRYAGPTAPLEPVGDPCYIGL